MPLSGNGSKLKVVTNVAGHQIQDEDYEYRRSVYLGKSLDEVKAEAPVVEPHKEEQVEPKQEPKRQALQIKTNRKQDKALLDAVRKDLRTRNIK